MLTASVVGTASGPRRGCGDALMARGHEPARQRELERDRRDDRRPVPATCGRSASTARTSAAPSSGGCSVSAGTAASGPGSTCSTVETAPAEDFIWGASASRVERRVDRRARRSRRRRTDRVAASWSTGTAPRGRSTTAFRVPVGGARVARRFGADAERCVGRRGGHVLRRSRLQRRTSCIARTGWAQVPFEPRRSRLQHGSRGVSSTRSMPSGRTTCTCQVGVSRNPVGPTHGFVDALGRGCVHRWCCRRPRESAHAARHRAERPDLGRRNQHDRANRGGSTRSCGTAPRPRDGPRFRCVTRRPFRRAARCALGDDAGSGHCRSARGSARRARR